jgi:hypothetical protein
MSDQSKTVKHCPHGYTDPEMCIECPEDNSDPLVSELRSLAKTEYPLCQEARLMLEMAVDAQLGKPIDVTRLTPESHSMQRIVKAILRYINRTPELISLLYDLDLLPEQLERNSFKWRQMLILANWHHKVRRVRAHAQQTP